MSHYFGLTPSPQINTQATAPAVAAAYPGSYLTTGAPAPGVPTYVPQAAATQNVAVFQAASQPMAYAMGHPRGPSQPTAYAQFPGAPGLTAFPQADATYYAAAGSSMPGAQYGTPASMVAVGRPPAAWPNNLSVAPPPHLTGTPQLLASSYATPGMTHSPAVASIASPYQIGASNPAIAHCSTYNPALHQLQQSINAAANAQASLQPMVGLPFAPQSQIQPDRGIALASNNQVFQKQISQPGVSQAPQLSANLSSVMYQDARYSLSNPGQPHKTEQQVISDQSSQNQRKYNPEITSSGHTYTGYEAALYSAATTYYQQQQLDKSRQSYGSNNTSNTSNDSIATGNSKPRYNNNNQFTDNNRAGRQNSYDNDRNYWQNDYKRVTNNRDNYNKTGHQRNPNGSGSNRSNSDETIHYCDVCKISCAGLTTYREHLAGQNHIKRDAAARAADEMKQFDCTLCDVSCGGKDAYNMHIRSARHTKNVSMKDNMTHHHQSDNSMTNQNRSGLQPSNSRSSSSSNTAAIRKLMSSAPKINFFGKNSQAMMSKSSDNNSIKQSNSDSIAATIVSSSNINAASSNITLSSAIINSENEPASLLDSVDSDQPPIGAEYVQVVTQSKNESNSAAKVVTYLCKLCDCKFNDANSKEMHLRGRRHRLQYKKKVDPKLDVDAKTIIRNRKLDDYKPLGGQFHEDWRHRLLLDPRKEMLLMEWDNYGGAPASKGLPPPQNFLGGGVPFVMCPQGSLQKVESCDDRHVKAKHWSISSTESERQAISKFLSNVERALKQSSSQLTLSEWDTDSSVSTASGNSVLRGVDKIGVAAKGLVLHGDFLLDVVLHVAIIPTVDLLERLSSIFLEEINKLSPEESYEVSSDSKESCMVIRTDQKIAEDESHLECRVTLASPLVRSIAEGASAPKASVNSSGENSPAENDQSLTANSEELNASTPLNKEKCLQALARLRHAKWFQANGSKQENCLMIIRIFRDLCMRVPTWNPLKEWEMELLVVQCLNSVGQTVLSPGVALRRVFECVASGMLINSKPGLKDPCEKEVRDALCNLTCQEIEDITASAQHALRLIAFRQIHKVLDMDPLPAIDQPQNSIAKKRVLDASNVDNDENGPTFEKKFKT